MADNTVLAPRPIGHRLFTDGVTRPVYQDERGQFVEEDGDRVDGMWLVPAEDGADTPVIVDCPVAPIPLNGV